MKIFALAFLRAEDESSIARFPSEFIFTVRFKPIVVFTDISTSIIGSTKILFSQTVYSAERVALVTQPVAWEATKNNEIQFTPQSLQE